MQPNDVDVLVVGAGLAGLATAIQLKKRLAARGSSASVVVIEKSAKLGFHSLSGSVFEMACMDQLIPDWRDDKHEFIQTLQQQRVETDTIHVLTPRHAVKMPSCLLPGTMKHHGDCLVSVGKMVEWLGRRATQLGVEIYCGFSAHDLLIEDGQVRGVILGEKGVDRDGNRLPNYMEQEVLRAKVTVLGDGALGPLSLRLIDRMGLAKGRNPQVYSLGVKQLIKLPDGNRFGTRRALHTMGYPNRADVLGGGFMYDMGKNVVAVGLVMALDWRYADLNPQQELELFKAHPFIASLLEGGQVIAAGVKCIPEGGYYSMPQVYTDGALLVGDSAGLVNMSKLKGLHLAVLSGMAAGDAIDESLHKDDYSASALAIYQKRLEENGVIREMRRARNFRQVFATRFGMLLGAPLSLISHLIPWRLRIKEDRQHASRARMGRSYGAVLDRTTFVSLSGTAHDDELRPHVRIKQREVCEQCMQEFGGTCVVFCPGEAYTFNADTQAIAISSENCMHCKTCVVKCPHNNIEWEAPQGGQGPKFRQM